MEAAEWGSPELASLANYERSFWSQASPMPGFLCQAIMPTCSHTVGPIVPHYLLSCLCPEFGPLEDVIILL